MSSSDDVKKAVDSAVDAALSRLRTEIVDSVLRSLPAPPPPQAPPPQAAASASPGPLRGQIFTLLDGGGQVEILNRLMGTITTWWDRSVLYLVKGTQYQPWDAKGFEGGIGNAAAKAGAVDLNADTLLDAAIAGTGGQAGNGLLDERMGAPSGLRAAVPLGIRNKPAAVLYVDGPRLSDEASLAALEILARTCAASIELAMLTKREPPYVRTQAVKGLAAAPASTIPVAEEPSGFDFGAASVEAEMEVEVEAEAPPAPKPVAAPAPAAWPTPVQAAPAPPAPAPPRVAAPAASAWPTPVAPAPPPQAPAVVTAPPPAPAAPARPAPAATAAPAAAAPEGGTLDPRELLKGGAKPVVDAGQSLDASKTYSRWKPIRDQMKAGDEVDPALAAVPEGERPKHVEARKIARLLVSEIKLYNEAKVAVGRKNKDLYERLKDDIERSRQTYVEKIDPAVAGKTNYFRDELVATLGEGDASSFGPGLR